MLTIHTKIWTKRIFLLTLVVFTMLLFSGCYDLGKFGDTAQYYSSFGDVKLISQTGAENVKQYSFEDYFYNKESINHFGGDIVSQEEYIYLILPVKSSFNLAEFSMYLKSEKSGLVYFSIFVLDTEPTDIRKYSDPKERYDSDGNLISYGDPDSTNSLYSGSVSLSANSWESFTAKLNKYHITNDKNIVIKFENNSGLGKDNGYENIAFQLTNILIRAV